MHWKPVLTFQMHGFHIIFFLACLRHDGNYETQELAQHTFPRSLEELVTFVSLKNMRKIMTVSDSFRRLCRPVRDAHRFQEKRHHTHPSIYFLVDSTKSRRGRFCALRFD
ncbi:hypothetical protein BCR43DRAFT_64611 [Syncephalastrum racemosum]|uniref:F-box domain-containing protein n=1 Tax=Syncephalastrum racemosum TaxID=13706 RepID=A0A1X2HXL3_SYNRA|nr:hypothetical protein BCR43DRAFT_64611 [Syncephalastrum racemosum]